MRTRWRLILPAIGLILFAVVTYDSVATNRKIQGYPARYFWWSSIRLDPHPLTQQPTAPTPCKNDAPNCTSWDLRTVYRNPGWLATSLILSAFPAFLLWALSNIGLSRLGVNQILSFMIGMPPLLFAWYYFVGSLIDRLKGKATRSSETKLGSPT